MLLTPRTGGGSAARVTSVTVFTVPVAVVVGNVVYGTSGANAVDRADNTSISTTPVMGLVISKPTTTTAILLLFGETPDGVLSGLTPDGIYFLGTAGGITLVNPTAVGSVNQIVGQALDSGTLLFHTLPDILL